MEKRIYYQNRTFLLGTTQRYYYASKQGKMIALHRYKYEQEVGPIPKGFHVHHKDGNCFNNDISNLEPIDPKKHYELHPPSEETLKRWQAAGIKMAAIWHSSEEGKKWHDQHYEKMKDKLHSKIERECFNCGTKVNTQYRNIACYCSNNCKSAFRRKQGLHRENVNCIGCGEVFSKIKYKDKKYCSVKCERKYLT